ncbi:hypothetical protein HCN44_011339 [Aphidius gifuensis]|uniref:Peptidase S1 domain-containing protein n=1 Tax=Aphidius gifuensis TaxID=684658 RepID=A0A835CV70_APHGI|nr:hypothetical protein HCN44_011339 [Aphidius gifuensis]
MTIDERFVGIGKLFRDDDKIKNRLQVSGWGTQPSGNTVIYQRLLKKIQIIRPRKPECIFIYDVALRKNQYCAYGIPKTARVTWGDGGGPVFEFRKIYGIVSISLITEDSTFLYTKILAYDEWINQMMSNH